MSKAQFLELLSEKLSEELSRADVMNHLNYYESYITGEIAKGRSEEDVMNELGDPYMIARTIIDTHTGEAFEDIVYEETVNAEPVERQSQKSYDKAHGKTVVMGNWGCLLTALILILVGVAVISVVSGLIAVLLPVLVPVLVVLLVLFFIKGKRR